MNHNTPWRILMIGLVACIAAQASGTGARAAYIGGTLSKVANNTSGSIDAIDEKYFVFYARHESIRVPYERISIVEYGQKVDRRYLEAILISPLFLIAKRRSHFLTIGYVDSQGRQQAVVLEVEKGDIRQLLVSLEARTGRRVEYQDEEARKAGKG